VSNLYQYIPAAAPVFSFILLLGCKWISTKSKIAPTVTTVTDGKVDQDGEKGLATMDRESK
jgi:hypothetical protein